MQKKCFFIDFRIFFRIFPPYFRFFRQKKEKNILISFSKNWRSGKSIFWYKINKIFKMPHFACTYAKILLPLRVILGY